MRACTGIKIVSIGIESLTKQYKKHGNGSIKEDLNSLIKNCHDNGIIVEGNLIFGMDSDNIDIFDIVADYYKNSDIDSIFCDILTPYPNTSLFERMLKDKRIIDMDWSHYDYRHVVYKPLNMSIEQLVYGFIKSFNKITNPKLLLKKVKAVYDRTGITRDILTISGLHCFNRYDALRKTRHMKEFINKFENIAPDNSLEIYDNY